MGLGVARTIETAPRHIEFVAERVPPLPFGVGPDDFGDERVQQRNQFVARRAISRDRRATSLAVGPEGVPAGLIRASSGLSHSGVGLPGKLGDAARARPVTPIFPQLNNRLLI